LGKDYIRSLRYSSLAAIATVTIATKLELARLLATVYRMLMFLPRLLHSIVLLFFRSINQKGRENLPVWRMEVETSEHVHLAVQAFKWIILPVSLLQLFSNFSFLGESALTFVFCAQLIFLYSSFVPDLPSIFRKKKGMTERLPRHKKYALLLFAPLFIWAVFSGTQVNWKTNEDFHNFRSLGIYFLFLLLCGFLAFGGLTPTIKGIAETLSFPLYGVTGYLIHLKVDKIW
jgi:hypothetical protein